MQIQELKILLFTHKKSTIKSEFESKKVSELLEGLACIEDLELENIALGLIKSGFFGLKELCEAIEVEFISLAAKRANEFVIKDYEGTQYEQELFKRRFCYQKLLECMPKSFCALIQTY